MAEKTRKAIHQTAKGKTTNGKTGRRTTGRARATAKPTLERKKTAQAEAEKKPAAANGGNHSGSGSAAEPVPGEKHGLALLKQKAVKLIDEQGAELVIALMKEGRNGNASAARLLVMLAKYSEPEMLATPHGRDFMKSILNMANEPEFEHPEEEKKYVITEVGKDVNPEVKAPAKIELGNLPEAELAGVTG